MDAASATKPGFFSRATPSSQPSKTTMTSKQFAPVLETIKHDLQELLSSIHQLPSQEIYQLREFLQQGEYEKAKSLTSSMNLPEGLQKLSKLLSETGHEQEALQILNQYIREEEGHLGRITDAAGRLMPRIVDPLGNRFADVMLDRFCAEPGEALILAHDRLQGIVNKLKQNTPVSQEERALAAQALKDYLKELDGDDAVALTALHEALSKEDPLILEALQPGMKTLSQAFEGAKGVIARIVQSAFNTARREFTTRVMPSILSSDAVSQPPLLSAVPELLHGTESRQPVGRMDPSSLLPLLRTEAALLASNASKVFAALVVLEKVAGVQISERDIRRWIATTNSSGASFRQQVFTYLESQSLDFFPLWTAKISYFLLAPLMGFFASGGIQNVLEYVISLIERHAEDQYKSALADSIGLMNEHTTNLNDAFNIVAGTATSKGPTDAPPPTGTIVQRLERELGFPAYREGMTEEEFYGKVSSAIVERFCPEFNWGGKFTYLLTSLRFSWNSYFRFLNPVISILTHCIAFVVRLALAVPELLLNFLIKFVIKRALVQHRVVQNVVESSRQGVGFSHAYAHNFNLFFLGKLREAWDRMNNQGEEAIDLVSLEKSVPVETRDQLQTLVSTTFVVLEKQKRAANNSDELRHFCENDMPLQFLETLGNRLIMQEANAMGTTVGYLAGLLHMFFQREQLLEVMHYSLATLNMHLFSNMPSPSQDDKKAAENAVLHFLNQILSKAIRDAVTEKCNPLKGIQREADAFIDKVKEEVQSFAEAAQPSLGLSQFSGIINAWKKIKVSCANLLAHYQGARNVNMHSLAAFNNVLLALSKHLNQMTSPLQILEQHTARETLRQFVSDFREMRSLSQEAVRRACQQTLPQFQKAVAALSSWENRLKNNYENLDQHLRRYLRAATADAAFANFSTHLTSLDLIDALPLTAAEQTQLKATARQRPLTIEDITPLRNPTLQILTESGGIISTFFQGLHQDLTHEIQTNVVTVNAAIIEVGTYMIDLLQWNESLERIICIDSSPINLSSITEPAINKICQEIQARTAMIPRLLTTPYNWQGYANRFLLAFLRDTNE